MSSLEDQRQQTIEVTPEMIEAGADVVRLASLSGDFFLMAEEIATDVLRAALECRREHRLPQLSSPPSSRTLPDLQS